ncbi:MAG: VCBS repeat-containing protein, partial [Acidobacteriota bacterium]
MPSGQPQRARLGLLPLIVLLGTAPATAQPVFDGTVRNLAPGNTVEAPLIAVGDWSGDGELDLVWTSGGSFRVSEGDGAGNFTDSAEIMSGLTTLGPQLAAGDFNGDGLLDAIAGRGAGDDVALLLSGGGAGVLTTALLDLPRNSGAFPVVADADADGDDDVYLVELGMTILLNRTGTGLSVATDIVASSSQTARGFAITDIDGDQRADFIGPALDGEHGGLDVILITPNPVNGEPGIGAITVVPLALDSVSSLVTANLDTDTDLDIAVVGDAAGTTSLVTVRNDGPRNWSPSAPVPSINLGAAPDLAVADFDMDGRRDVVVSCTEPDCRMMALHHGQNLAAPGPVELLPVLAPATRLAVGDIDCDGDPDVVAGSSAGSTAILNLGGRNYEDQLFRPLRGVDLVLADVNGDAALDALGLDTGALQVALN